jgi:hypothetical protein
MQILKYHCAHVNLGFENKYFENALRFERAESDGGAAFLLCSRAESDDGAALLLCSRAGRWKKERGIKKVPTQHQATVDASRL